jgi:hypothetical protein
MIPVFPPQFFILLGIDIFLGGSIGTILFDTNFPTGLPYIMEFAALAGFGQLLLDPQYLSGYPEEIQFYYSAAFLTLALFSVLTVNTYVVLVKGNRVAGAFLAIMVTLPSVLSSIYFVSAYINNIAVGLPLFPIVPWTIVWLAFFAASAFIFVAMVFLVRGRRRPDQTTS